MFDAVSRTGHHINVDIAHTFQFKLDEKGVLKISTQRIFVDSQIMTAFFVEEVDRLAALEAEAEVDEK
jgi:hypothetical protein